MNSDLISGTALLASVLGVAATVTAYHKLSRMSQTILKESREHADNVVSQVEGLMALYARSAGLPSFPRSRGWAASPDMLHGLINQVQVRKPHLALECSSGLSTLVLANEMRRMGRGKVISLEHEAFYAEATRAMLRAHGLQDWAEVLHAPLCPVKVNDWAGSWYDTSVLPADLKADLLVVDGPPSTTSPLARYPALPMLLSRLSPGALVLADDSDRPDETAMVKRWTRDVPGSKPVSLPRCEKGCAALELPAA